MAAECAILAQASIFMSSACNKLLDGPWSRDSLMNVKSGGYAAPVNFPYASSEVARAGNQYVLNE
jgi:hypothetical protein